MPAILNFMIDNSNCSTVHNSALEGRKGGRKGGGKEREIEEKRRKEKERGENEGRRRKRERERLPWLSRVLVLEQMPLKGKGGLRNVPSLRNRR